MKTKDIAVKYGIDQEDFERFLLQKELKHSVGLMHINVWDEDVEEYVNKFVNREQIEAEEKRQAEEARIQMQQRAEEERIQKQKRAEEALRREIDKIQAMPKMLVSSGFSFEGYRIAKYSDFISSDAAVQIPRSDWRGGDNGSNLTVALSNIRHRALAQLKSMAYDLGCNAVIGVDYDYITMEPESVTLHGGTLYEPYVICVTANGNAVVIEKIEE